MVGHNTDVKTLLYAVGMLLALAHLGYGGQTNSTNAGMASLVATNSNSRAPAPTEITTLDGTTYKSVRILKVEPDGLMIEHAPKTGGIGLGKIKFVNLPVELQLKYGYDAQKAAEYQATQAAGEAKLRHEMRIQQEQVWAAERAKAEDNFNGRLEIDRQAEAARLQAELERERIEQEAERNQETDSVSTGSGRRWGRWGRGDRGGPGGR